MVPSCWTLVWREWKQQKIYLENEIGEELHFDDVIGENRALKDVLARAATVAPSEATVLILGETGTGKELVARAIHRLSGRCKENFIKLNCAAIPTGLLESELFGHERGAFTGAVNQKIGRLELADGGTLFLDEIGEIPLELQPKLLRVLQDHEFERLGSTRTIRVNLRVIAATNSDLARQMAERQFRSDLFYRLNVFPLRLPALRERREDIPALVFHFVQKYAARMHKEIKSVPNRTLDALMSYDWPGNIRELENLVERSVILTTGATLEAPTGELIAPHEPASNGTLREAEHVHVARVMEETGGNISLAAAKLGLKRTPFSQS
jgi:formate hydrogenlyase transcriptional activator